MTIKEASRNRSQIQQSVRMIPLNLFKIIIKGMKVDTAAGTSDIAA